MRKAECFSDAFDFSSPYTVIDEGLRVVRLQNIVGTVDKCGELNADFQYIKRSDKGEQFRRRQIDHKTDAQFFFPPIRLNKYGKKYYIVDGHRRVSSAKKHRIEFIDAYVNTYIPEGDKKTRKGITARKRFELETGITTINLTDERRFEELLRDVYDYAGKKPDKESAPRWKAERFLPGCRAIEESELRNTYGGLELGDIYALLHQFYFDYFGGFPRGAGMQSLISTYCAARCPGKKRKKMV
jgi:hypothetical protein